MVLGPNTSGLVKCITVSRPITGSKSIYIYIRYTVLGPNTKLGLILVLR